MGDRSWMQVTIVRCPTKRAKVAGLLRDYVYMGDDETEVTDGTSYDTDEIALGSAVEVAGELISLAPQCSFSAVQDGSYGALGDQVLYTPRLGRFDAEHAGEAGTVLTHSQVETILATAAEHAWTERDTMLRLHRADLTPANIRAWESRPGVAEAVEVAYGIPWDAELTGTKVPLAKRRAWLAVIDRNYATAAARRAEALADLARELAGAGLAELAEWQAWLAVTAAVGGGEAHLAGALRQLAEAAGAVPVHGQASYLPMRLKTWAEIAATAYEGRRKGRRPDHASSAKKAARHR
jgi:hypothetical protein